MLTQAPTQDGFFLSFARGLAQTQGRTSVRQSNPAAILQLRGKDNGDRLLEVFEPDTEVWMTALASAPGTANLSRP